MLYKKSVDVDEWLKYCGDWIMYGCYDSIWCVKELFLDCRTMQTLEWIRDSLCDLMNMKKEDIFIMQQGVGFEIKELSLRKELIIESVIGIR